jgi:hypothetical protein
VKFDLISGDDGLVQVEILDQYQHKLKMGSYNLVKGRNKLTLIIQISFRRFISKVTSTIML